MPDEEMQVSPSNLDDAAKGKTDTILVTHGKRGGRPVKDTELGAALSQAGIKKDWKGTVMIAFPDVCKTPGAPGPVPIPYPNLAKIGDIPGESKRVKIGKALQAAGFKGIRVHSLGDEAGMAKGVMGAKAITAGGPMLFSMDVKVEGKNTVLGHELTHMTQQNGHVPHRVPHQSKTLRK